MKLTGGQGIFPFSIILLFAQAGINYHCGYCVRNRIQRGMDYTGILGQTVPAFWAPHHPWSDGRTAYRA